MSYIDRIKVGSTMHLIEPTLYAECTTAAGTATKQTAAINNFSLVAGIQVAVKFTVTNTAAVSDLKLQIGTNTDAKPIKYRGENLPAIGTLAANHIYNFIYDGTSWELVGDLDTNVDKSVFQGTSTTDQWRKVLLAYNSGTSSTTNVSEATNVVYWAKDISVQPSTGTLYAKLLSTNSLSSTGVITAGAVLQINPSYNSGYYIEKTVNDVARNLSLHVGGTSGDMGVCDDGNNKWLIKIDTNNKVYVNGVEFPTTAKLTDTWNALSTSQAGYVSQAPNDTTKFLRGDATWAKLPVASTNTAGIIQIGSGATNAAAGNHNHDGIYAPVVDGGYLPLSGGVMTGNIRRRYSAASADPMITMLSVNQDIILWEAGHDDGGGISTTASNHYKLLYKGTGNDGDNSNYLQLRAHKSSDVIAVQIDEIGKVTLPQMATGTADTPIYINSNGVITAGTKLGASAYHADSYFALASHGNHVPTTQTANNLTFLRNDNSWYKLTKNEVNALINLLDTGSSPLTANDYVITQYVGGGTTTTTYHRRPASLVVNSTLVKAALGTDSSTTTQWLNKKGEWSTPTAAQVGAVTKLSSSTDNAIVRFDGNSGAIQNSEVTIDDNNNIYTTGLLQTGRYFHNVAEFGTNGTPKEILIKTKIPFTNGSTMPKIYFHIDNYGPGKPTELSLVFYIYNNAFCNMGATSNTSHRPIITLSTYTESNKKYVAIGLGLIGTQDLPDAYYIHFNVDFLDIWPSSNTRTAHALGWIVESNSSNTSIIPETDRKTVSYVDQSQQALQAGITTTQYGISYYSNTTGTFASTGAGTSGQYLKSNGTSAPTWATFPTTWTPSSHTHGDITNDGKIGSTANYAVYTTTSGKLTAGSLAVTDSTASTNNTTKFVQAVTQDSKGQITVTKASLDTSGTWSGTATKATTTADTSNTLYPVGVTSSATTTLKHDTSITMKSGAIEANKYKATHTAGGQREFEVVYSSTIDMAFMVGTGNENHGIYDYKKGSNGAWILSAGTNNNWELNGNAATATKATGDVDGNAIKTTYAKLGGAAFTGAVTVQTPTADMNPATKKYVDNILAANDALIYKGTKAGASSSTNGGTLMPAGAQGDTYKVSTAGYINGKYCEVGDMIICVTDVAASTTSNYTTTIANWNIIQTSDGTVSTSETSVIENTIPRYSGTTGKFIKSTNVSIDNDDNIITTGDYLETTGGRFQYVQLLPSGSWENYTDNAWYRCCKINKRHGGYANFIIQFGGTWSTGAPTVATVSVQLLIPNITLLHCSRVGNIQAIRLVNNDGYWLDIQINKMSSGNIGVQTATFIGNVIISDIATTPTITTDETTPSSILNFKTNYSDDNIYKLSNKINILDTTPSTTTSTGALIVSGGIGTGGRITAQEIHATRPMVVKAGKIYSNISGSDIQITKGTAQLFSDGLAISNPATANDVGWLRALGTGETDTVFEIATGDDGGTGEKIVARQYTTSNTVAHEAVLLGNTGETSFPVSVTAPQFVRAGIGSSWNKGRDNALLRTTAPVGEWTSWTPVISMKTHDGSWDIGTYNTGTTMNELKFNYCADTVYTGTNANGPTVTFNFSGNNSKVTATTFAGDLSGNASSASLLKSSATANTTGLQYYSGQPTIGSADGNAYDGSSSNYKLWSYPADYTGHTTVANIQTIRMYWGQTYFHDIFASPNNENLLHRSVLSGSAKGWRLILDSANYNDYAAAKSHTHPITDITWAGNKNFTASATANNQEWSLDLTPGSYTGTYWHVWSSKNSKSILACYTDTNNVAVPSGNFSVGGSTSLGGQTTINYTTPASSAKGSSQLQICDSSTSAPVAAIELRRGAINNQNGKASWQIINDRALKFAVDYSDNAASQATTYNHTILTLDYNNPIGISVNGGGKFTNGLTVGGQILTSFKSSIAMGSYGSAQTTIPNLLEEVRYSSGCAGSFNLTTAYTLNNVTLATGWYNFMYIPHRSGGVNGAASGDNCDYGALYLHRMNAAGYADYVLAYSSGAAKLLDLHASFQSAVTDGQIIIADGTAGHIKTSGYTISSFATADHTHNYAGSSSAGGSATSAVKLDGGLATNDVSTYTNLKLTTAKGGYYGFLVGNSTSCMNVMGAAQHNGLYCQAHGRWITYYDATNDRIAIGSATTKSGYVLAISGKTHINDATTVNGTVSATTITLTNTDATPHIGFSRTGGHTAPNYINVPSGSALAVSVGGAAGANIAVMVENKSVNSFNDAETSLGTSTYEWKETYSKNYVVGKKIKLEYNSTDDSLDFIFI